MRLFNILPGLHRAAVEAGSTAIDASKDTIRRRGSSNGREWPREVFDDKHSFRS